MVKKLICKIFGHSKKKLLFSRKICPYCGKKMNQKKPENLYNGICHIACAIENAKAQGIKLVLKPGGQK